MKLIRSIQEAYHALLPESLRIELYQFMPSTVQRRLDNFDRQIKEMPPRAGDLTLPADPIGPSRFSRRVNKLCDEDDWHGEEWFSLFDEFGEPHFRQQKHRKGWEWAQGVYALKELGLLHEDAVALGVGAGIESVLFYFANQIKLVVATDIYGQGDFVEYEASASMLDDPARFAKIPYREDHLQVLYMDGRRLQFPDNHFDFAFSFSSIEHFGGHEAASQTVSEMARVVKPGGAVVLTTEVVLNGIQDQEFFLPQEVDKYLISGTNLQPIEDISYAISDKTIANHVDCSDPDYIDQLPHIVLKHGPVLITSLSLVLEKPMTQQEPD